MKTIIVAILALLVMEQKAICMAKAEYTIAEARALYRKADAELNKAYKEAMGELDKTKVAQLREDERNWLSYRDDMMEADFSPDKRKSDAEYWETLAGYAQERTVFLRAWSGKHVTAGITGEYSDCYDGTLELNETKDGIGFSLSVMRTRAHNEGSIGGILHPKNGKAYFKQELAADEGFGPPCELVFTFAEGHIVKIEQKVADSLAGHNANYDGDYYKIGKFKKPE